MDNHGAVALIPARGGSKRIPGKNIRNFAGRPIIAYSIDEAVGTGLFDRIIVSTDSPEIAETAKSCGAEVPFLRPAEYSNDFVGYDVVVIHALDFLRKEGYDAKYVCLIHATAPFLRKEDILRGFEILKEKKASTVFSVGRIACPIMRALKLNDDGKVAMFWPEYEKVRSNDIPDAYQDAGQFYWLDVETFVRERKFFSSDSYPVILPKHIVHDIDTAEDWETAEILFSALR